MPTYVFIDKAEFDSIKAEIQKLQKPKPIEKPKPVGPLAFAIVALLVATIISASIPDAKWSLYSYIIGVVIAQCGVDLYRGDNRPKWSAAFRLLALATWYATQLLSK